MALTVSGTAQFVDEGTSLELRVEVQPHFPLEHDRLSAIARCAPWRYVMEQGKLVWKAKLSVPADVPEGPKMENKIERHSLAGASGPYSEMGSGSQSTPTSARTEAEKALSRLQELDAIVRDRPLTSEEARELLDLLD